MSIKRNSSFSDYNNAIDLVELYFSQNQKQIDKVPRDSITKLMMSDNNVLSWLAWAFADFKSDLNYSQMLNFLKNEGKHSNESFIREKNPEQHLPTGRKVIFDVYTEISERKKVDTNEDSDEKTSDVKETIITYFDIENNSDGSHLREDMARGFIYGCNILVRSNGETYTADKYSDAPPVNVLWIFLSGAKMRENSVTVYPKYETECIFAEEGKRKSYPMPELNLIRIVDTFIGEFNENLINDGNTAKEKKKIGLGLLDLLLGTGLDVKQRLDYLSNYYGMNSSQIEQEVTQMNENLEIIKSLSAKMISEQLAEIDKENDKWRSEQLAEINKERAKEKEEFAKEKEEFAQKLKTQEDKYNSTILEKDKEIERLKRELEQNKRA